MRGPAVAGEPIRTVSIIADKFTASKHDEIREIESSRVESGRLAKSSAGGPTSAGPAGEEYRSESERTGVVRRFTRGVPR